MLAYGVDGSGSTSGRDTTSFTPTDLRATPGPIRSTFLWMLEALSPDIKGLCSEAHHLLPSSVMNSHFQPPCVIVAPCSVHHVINNDPATLRCLARCVRQSRTAHMGLAQSAPGARSTGSPLLLPTFLVTFACFAFTLFTCCLEGGRCRHG